MSDHTKDCCEHNVACDVSNCAYNADGKRISETVNGTTYRQLQPHDGTDC